MKLSKNYHVGRMATKNKLTQPVLIWVFDWRIANYKIFIIRYLITKVAALQLILRNSFTHETFLIFIQNLFDCFEVPFLAIEPFRDSFFVRTCKMVQRGVFIATCCKSGQFWGGKRGGGTSFSYPSGFEYTAMCSSWNLYLVLQYIFIKHITLLKMSY